MKFQVMVDVNVNTTNKWTCEMYTMQMFSIKCQQVLKMMINTIVCKTHNIVYLETPQKKNIKVNIKNQKIKMSWMEFWTNS